uniref:Gustatory receptor n=1 Tax=Globodera rostochiensis TaxID=31243 RepID=A0A914IF03_GLORO
MQIYSKILLQTCITDLLLLIMTLLFQNYTFATKSGEQKTILDGLITINGAENRVWALLAVVCQIWLVGFSVVGYLSQFIFRYLVLNWNKKVSSCNYSIIFLINLLLPLAYCVHLFLCLYPSDGHEFLDDKSAADFIGVNLSEKIILVGYSNNKLNLTIGSCYLIIVCTITYAIMFILALLMHNNLKKLSKTITSKDLTAKMIEMNKQLSRNLLFIQASMPLMVCFGKMEIPSTSMKLSESENEDETGEDDVFEDQIFTKLDKSEPAHSLMRYFQFICLSCDAISLTEKPGFSELFEEACPSYSLKSRTFFTSLLEKKYEEKLALVKGRINSANYLSFTTDLWENRKKKKCFLSLTAHFIDNSFERQWNVGN